MKNKILIISLVLFVLLGLVGLSKVYSENQSEVDKAVNYLKSQSQTAWTTMALSAAGVENIGNYLDQVSFDGTLTTDYAKYILALVASGENPTDFKGKNFVEKLKNSYDSSTSQFGSPDYISDDIWAILAFGSVGKEYLSEVQKAKQFILQNQNPDGGWSFGLKGSSSSADMTASAIMALIECGVKTNDSTLVSAENYLKSVQNDDGGFPGWTGESSASSDAWVISAIYKLGEDPANWLKNGKNPISHLKSLQDSEKGFFYDTEGGAGEDSFVATRTSYAVIALSGKTYPIATVYNLHSLRIEGFENTVCITEVNGGTPLDLIIEGAKACNFDYSLQYYESYDSFLLTKINDEQNWEYRVNSVLPTVGADNYHLNPGDEVLWYGVDNLWGDWFETKIELSKTEDLIRIQVEYFDSNSWQNLEKEGIKVKIGDEEFITDNTGKIEISLSSLESGLYQVFVEQQTVDTNGDGTPDLGYIRSEKESFGVGQVPSEHEVGLKVEIEKIEAPEEGEQEAISFSVSPDVLDFGKLKPGESSTRDLTISNGESNIYLETEVSGASVFQDNLQIDEKFWQIFSIDIQAGESKNLKAELTVPKDYSGDFGQQEGELTFWAIKK